MNRLIQVFRTGTHTDSSGTERTFSADDLRKIADKFDPSIGAVPLVKGHPATDDPALGWVSRFMFEETSGVLYAVPEKVDADFRDEVRARKYARISIALYSPGTPNNPVPGMYYPRHIGFLGAAAPAVTGLKAANFNLDEGFLMFDSNDDKQMGKFASAIATAFTSSLTALGFKPAEAAAAPADPATVKVEDSPEFQASEAKRIEAETKLADAEKATQDAADEARRVKCAAFADTLVKSGKLTPVEGERLVPILFALENDATEIEFSAGEGEAPVKLTSSKIMTDFLSGLPVRVEFSELSGENNDSLTAIEFNAPPGSKVSSDQLAQHQRIQAYSLKHGVSYLDAVTAITGV